MQSGWSICFSVCSHQVTIDINKKICEFHIYCNVITVSRKLHICFIIKLIKNDSLFRKVLPTATIAINFLYVTSVRIEISISSGTVAIAIVFFQRLFSGGAAMQSRSIIVYGS